MKQFQINSRSLIPFIFGVSAENKHKDYQYYTRNGPDEREILTEIKNTEFLLNKRDLKIKHDLSVGDEIVVTFYEKGTLSQNPVSTQMLFRLMEHDDFSLHLMIEQEMF